MKAALVPAVKILGFILFLFAAVIGFTRPAFHSYFKLSDKGSIGDAIGGITSPIIGLLGAILVYISFMEQVKANRIVTAKNDFNFIYDLFEQIKSDYNNFTFLTGFANTAATRTGGDALLHYTNHVKGQGTDVYKRSSVFYDLQFMTNTFSLIIDKIINSTFTKKEKDFLLKIIIDFYEIKLKMNVTKLISYSKAVGQELKEFTYSLESIENNVIIAKEFIK